MKTWITGCLLLLAVTNAGAQQKKRPGITPDHLKLQYAGSIGFISVGAGYEWAKKKIHGDLYYGYVPAAVGGVDIHSVTGKFTWRPFSKTLDNDVQLDLLTTGMLLNYAFGRRYHLFSRTKYSFVYYGFPTAAHINFFVGGGISKKRTGLYYELGITDRDLVSYANNTRNIHFFEIVNIGIGARYRLR